jgi:hypothetical protein
MGSVKRSDWQGFAAVEGRSLSLARRDGLSINFFSNPLAESP